MLDPNIATYFIPVAQAAEEASKSGIPGTFGIDTMKFVAQLVNFALVLFILWKWVFTPVTKKLEERTAKIEKAMKDALTTEQEKQEFALWKQQEMKKSRIEAEEILTKAQKETTAIKDDLLRQSKEEQAKLIEQTRKQIEQEKNTALQSAKNELADIITTATEKILRQKLDSKSDAELIKESLKGISK